MGVGACVTLSNNSTQKEEEEEENEEEKEEEEEVMERRVMEEERDSLGFGGGGVSAWVAGWLAVASCGCLTPLGVPPVQGCRVSREGWVV